MRQPIRVSVTRRRGFSLVLSLTVMAMLLLLCISVAALMTIELRVARGAISRERARLNAQAALRLAIGQLQESAGPDRRVTAALDLLNGPGEKAPGDWWTGVWRTDRLLAEAGARAPDPIIHRNLTTGGLEDRRAASGYDAKTEIADLLISIPTDPGAPKIDRQTKLNEASPTVARLLGPGHLPAGAKDTDGVLVPKIPLYAQPGATATTLTLGHLAWWTADEGVKARTDLREPAYPTAAETQTAARIAPTLMGPGTLNGLASLQRPRLAGTDPLRDRLTPGNLALHPDLDAESPLAAKQHFHSLTGGSLSVLADPARGGLKRDLTPFLISPTGDLADDATGVGLKDDTPLVDYAPEAPNTKDNGRETEFYKDSSPRFGILRDWARIRAAAGAGGKVPATAMTQVEPGISGGAAYHDGMNMRQVKLTEMTRHAMSPILAEVGVFMRLTYDESGNPGTPPTAPKLRLQLYPRIQLWNPYNVTLTGKEYLVHIRMLTPLSDGGSYFEVTPQSGGPVKVFFNLPSWLARGGSTWGSLAFVLRCGDIPPGECAVYTAAAPAKPYDAADPKNNLLTPAATTPGNCFFLTSSTGTGGRAALRVESDFNPAGARYALAQTTEDDVSFMMKELPPGGSVTDMSKADMIQYTGCSAVFGSGQHVGPSFNLNPSALRTWTDTTAPLDHERHGFRLRRFREPTENSDQYAPGTNVDVAQIANYNLRASTNFRYPSDNNTDLNAPYFWSLNYIRDYPNAEAGWVTPPIRGGRTVGNPFAAIGEWPGVNTFTLFDLPEKPAAVGAIAMFRHARLSEYPWHPSYAVGESLISPHIPKNDPNTNSAGITCLAPNVGDWTAMGNGASYAVQAMQDLPKSEQLIYDQSYELNTTLYDRFFLSTGDDADKGKFLTDPAKSPLPNARLVLNPQSSATGATRLTALTHHRRSAAELMVAGGFNVNSTRVEAWRALFAALRDVPLGSRAAGETAGKTAYSRLLNPPAGGKDETVTEKNPEAHAGFRTLTDDQIALLAEKMVEQVRARGPFLSVADFVNRRLSLSKDYARPRDPANVPPAYCGALQAAIEAAKLNAGLVHAETIIPAGSGFAGTKHLADQKALAKTYGLPGYLTQGDLLQTLDPVLTARSDTFRIRTLGESEDGATVHLEAMVQRFPDPIRPDATGLNPDLKTGRDFGRRFRVVALRELSADEI